MDLKGIQILYGVVWTILLSKAYGQNPRSLTGSLLDTLRYPCVRPDPSQPRMPTPRMDHRLDFSIPITHLLNAMEPLKSSFAGRVQYLTHRDSNFPRHPRFRTRFSSIRDMDSEDFRHLVSDLRYFYVYLDGIERQETCLYHTLWRSDTEESHARFAWGNLTTLLCGIKSERMQNRISFETGLATDSRMLRSVQDIFPIALSSTSVVVYYENSYAFIRNAYNYILELSAWV